MTQPDFEFETWESIAAVEKMPTPQKRPLTQDELTAIECLSRVTFLPASWDKRFNRDVLQPAKQTKVLSEKAVLQLWRMFRKYRAQWRLSPRETDRLLNYACDHGAPDFRKVNAAAREQKQIDEMNEKYGQRLQGH